jgi:hypothetical protein
MIPATCFQNNPQPSGFSFTRFTFGCGLTSGFPAGFFIG